MAPEGRPAAWAQPIALEGVPNLHRVSANVYRSAQPTAEGFRNLAKECGIRTVINFRQSGEDDDEAEGTGLQLKLVEMFTGSIKDKHVVATMRLLRQQGDGPFLIHCKHGADRTGLMTAMYRVLEEGWSLQDAKDELVDGGYGFHGFWWRNIPRYVLNADIVKLREQIVAP
jgi:protein tyrosine/serine phosphatase